MSSITSKRSPQATSNNSISNFLSIQTKIDSLIPSYNTHNEDHIMNEIVFRGVAMHLPIDH